MKATISGIGVILVAATLALVYFSSSAIAESDTKLETTMNLPSLSATYEDLGSIKNAYSAFHGEWLEFASEGKRYVACLITMPSYGSSSHILRGWVSRDGAKPATSGHPKTSHLRRVDVW